MTDEIYRNDYMRRLLIEGPYIRAKLENPGGSVIQTAITADTEQMNEYSSQIGSSFHLDLIETEIHLADLPNGDQHALLTWAMGVSAKEAALYYGAKGTVLRKRRQRNIDSLTQRMNDGSRITDTRRASGRDSQQGSSPTREIPQETGDNRREKTENDQGAGDNPVLSGKQET